MWPDKPEIPLCRSQLNIIVSKLLYVVDNYSLIFRAQFFGTFYIFKCFGISAPLSLRKRYFTEHNLKAKSESLEDDIYSQVNVTEVK